MSSTTNTPKPTPAMLADRRRRPAYKPVVAAQVNLDEQQLVEYFLHVAARTIRSEEVTFEGGDGRIVWVHTHRRDPEIGFVGGREVHPTIRPMAGQFFYGYPVSSVRNLTLTSRHGNVLQVARRGDGFHVEVTRPWGVQDEGGKRFSIFVWAMAVVAVAHHLPIEVPGATAIEIEMMSRL